MWSKMVWCLSVGILFICSCQSSDTINWLTWEQWNEVAKLKDKKGLIWIHSPNCGDCISMEEETFLHPKIIEYLNQHFYAIKLDKDEKNTINTKGRVFRYVSDIHGVTYHELAAALSKSPTEITTPTLVFLDENFESIVPIPQELSPKELDLLMHFVKEDAFKKMNVDEFKKTFQSTIK